MTQKGVATARLLLLPMTYDFICSVLNPGPEEEKTIGGLGLKTGDGWPSPDILEVLPRFRDQMKDVTEPTGFQSWVFVKKEDLSIIGDGGFRGEPDESGRIEIGYGLVEEEWQKGYGFEAVRALVDWAFSRKGVKKIRATCEPGNIGSVRILEKVGMTVTGRDGELICWEITGPA